MKALGIVLLLLAGAAFVAAVNVIQKTVAPGLGTYFGAFVIPCLLTWWGLIMLKKASGKGIKE